MKRWIGWLVLIAVVVGGFVGWQLYQSHQRNKEIGEGFKRQAEMIERMRAK